jgi:MFS family permease
MKQSGKKESVLNYGTVVMSVVHFFAHIYDNIYSPLLPLFRDEFNLSLQEIGVLASLPPLFQTLASLPIGYLTDRLGAKKTLTIGFLISTSSAVAVAVSGNVWMLFLAIGICYLTSTIYHPASFSYITKTASLRNRAKALGLQSMGGPLGLAIGPLSLSLFISLGLNWRFTYLFWIAPILLSLLAVWRLKPEERAIEDGAKGDTSQKTDAKMNPTKDPASTAAAGSQGSLRTIFSRQMVAYLVFSMVHSVGGQLIGVFFPLYLKENRGLTVSEVSFVYGIVSLFGVAAAPAGGVFADRFGNKRWLLTTYASSSLLFASALAAPTTPLFLGFYFIQGFMGSLSMSANSALIAGLTPAARRGLGYAVSFIPMSLVGSVTPTVAGFLAAQMGLLALFPLGIAVSLASLPLLKFGVKAR